MAPLATSPDEFVHGLGTLPTLTRQSTSMGVPLRKKRPGSLSTERLPREEQSVVISSIRQIRNPFGLVLPCSQRVHSQIEITAARSCFRTRSGQRIRRRVIGRPRLRREVAALNK